jgi:hypothetical protein
MMLRITRGMVATKPGHQGERGVSRQTIARGRPGAFRLNLWFLPRASIFTHGGRGCQPASGLPRALSSERGVLHSKSSGNPGRENAASCLVRHEMSSSCLIMESEIARARRRANRSGADYAFRAIGPSNGRMPSGCGTRYPSTVSRCRPDEKAPAVTPGPSLDHDLIRDHALVSISRRASSGC